MRKRGETIIVEKEGLQLLEVELHRIDAVLLFGNVQVSTQALAELLEQGVELALLSLDGRLRGQLTPHLISYDVADDRKRAKIARTLENFGDRVQRSVFELPQIDSNLLAGCLKALEGIELDEGDSIRIYPICEACRKGIILRGAEDAMQSPEVYIV